MAITKILETELDTIVDTNAFYSVGKSLLFDIYSCKNIGDFPCSRVLDEINVHRGVSRHANKKNFFVIGEVLQEKEKLLMHLNQVLSHYSDSEQTFRRGHLHPKFLLSTRRVNKYKERKNLNLKADNVIKSKALSTLAILCKDISRSIKTMEKKDITRNFSEEETQIYNKFIKYFSFISEVEDVKSNYFVNNNIVYKNRNPSNFNTDEKIISASLTQAISKPVNIISSDIDIKKMLDFFLKDKNHKPRFNVPYVENPVTLYSNYGAGFQVNGEWFGEELSTKTFS